MNTNNPKRVFGLVLVVCIILPCLYFFATKEENRIETAVHITTPTNMTVKPTNQTLTNVTQTPRLQSPATILYYTKVGPWYLKRPYSCHINCTFTTDHNKFRESQVVFFDLTRFKKGQVPLKNSTMQKYVGFSKEGPGYYPHLKDETFMRQFDWRVSYELDSDILEPYFDYDPKLFLTPPVKKEEKALAVFVASNCQPKNGRNSYVQELMKHISIDSYGKCLHNKDWPGSIKKKDVMKNYKFYLAFENHNAKDYVTEKYFEALIVGTVPVYMGASNIDDFTPSSRSIIKVSDFKDPEALSEYLKYLNNNETAYQEYLEWKHVGPSQKFKDLLKNYKMDSKCILCEKATEIAYKWQNLKHN